MSQHGRWVGVLMASFFLAINSGAQQSDSGGHTTGGAPVISSSALDLISRAIVSPVPRLIKFGGGLDAEPINVTDNVLAETGKTGSPRAIGILFSLYDVQEGGSPLWSEFQSVQLDDHGHYTVLLGATQPDGLPLDLFIAGKALWLGVQPQLPAAAEQRRVLLVAVPYALKAADADTLGGKPASAFLTVDSPQNGAAGASTTTFASDPTGASGHRVANPSEAAPSASSVSCSAVTSDGTATANYLAKFTAPCNIENSALFESGGNVGIGNVNPAVRLDVSGNTTIRGTLQLSSSGVATATAGFNSNPLDTHASSFDSATSTAVDQLFRWQAEPVGNNTTSPSGKLNLLFAAGTTPAETGLSIASNGRITFASGQVFPGTGSGTVTSITAGAGLAGGTITKSGSLSIPNAGVTNAMLKNSLVTVNSGTGLSGGGAVPLGGSLTLNVDTTKVAQLNGNNTFTGTITAAGFTGSGSGLSNVNAAALGGFGSNAFARLGATSNIFTGNLTASSFIGNGAGLTNVNAVTATTATNALNLGGQPPTAFQPAGSYATTGANTFSGDQNIAGNLKATGNVNVLGSLAASSASLAEALTGTTATFSGALTAAGAALPATAAATSSSGANSNPLDFEASSFNSGTTSAVTQLFRWVAEPAGNNTVMPSATLNLQYGSSTATPSETGLSIGANGVINFVAGQTFPIQGIQQLGGDLAGTATSQTVVGLRGNPVSAIAPTSSNQFLNWTGNQWAPAQPSFGNLSGGVADSQLTSAYSGVGSCATNQFVKTLTRNATPTCTTAVQASTAPGHEFATALSSAGALTYAQPTFSDLSGVAVASQLPTASASSQGVLQLVKDLSGTAAAPVVAGLQGNPVSNAAPTAYQVLEWNGSAWAPATLPGGGASTSAANTWTALQTFNAGILSEGPGTPTVQLGNYGPSWTSGSGSPTGACVVGSLYSRTNGGAGSTLYVCEGPSGSWTAK